MKIHHTKAGLGMAALVAVLFGTTASAAPISKCDAAKKKCVGKYVAAQMGCYAKAESGGVSVDPACLAKGVAKVTTVPVGKGCFDKNEAKVPNDCSNTGMAAAELAAADALIGDIVDDVQPVANTLTRCGAARSKCVGKKAAGLTGCSAKESKDGIGDATCAPKIMDKFGGVKGCDTNALNGVDCLGVPTTASLEAKVDAWMTGVDSRIEMTGCPTKLTFAGDATDPLSILDLGWTGIVHRVPIISNGEWTVTLSSCAGSSPPSCGVCNVNGPIANPGAGQIANRRCTNDTSIKCTSDAPCTSGGGTCQYFAGSNLGIGAVGITLCVVDQFNGPITGTANVESGALVTNASVIRRWYIGLTIDIACPRCLGDVTINDDSAGGTCNGGPRNGLTCDANGTVPGRPDFGQTSLDCPPDPLGIVATLPIDLPSATNPVTKTVTTSSPLCGDLSGERCLCDTCNNLAATPCASNADCGAGICGGKRCLGGTNNGNACPTTTACPGGFCTRAGAPSSSSACLDDTATPGILDCTDTGNGEGMCDLGPISKTCSVASGHAQRACSSDGDCGGGSGSCVAANRNCFLTGSNTGNGKVGTTTLVANGMADPPIGDTSSPTLGGVYCIGATTSSALNSVSGLPGPARVTIKGTAVSRP